MILSCRNIKKSFGTDEILNNITFTLEEKEKAAIIGVNGAGKSTLFKIITGELSCDDGEIIISNNTTIGYFSQNLEIDSNKTIYNELLSVFQDIIQIENRLRETEIEMSKAEGEKLDFLMKQYSAFSSELEFKNGYEYKSRIRGVIKGLGFTENEYDKPINHLSGGQKTRVALGKLLLSNPDILLLDEPTNHLDIESIQWLEEYLKAYTGSIMLITHDRYFIDKISEKIIEIENKKSKIYNGSYSFYAKKKEEDRQIQLNHYITQQKEIKHQEEVITKLRSFNREKSIKRAESREKALKKIELVEKPENLPEKMRLKIIPKKESGYDVLSINDLKKSFNDKTLFENISFDIKKGEKTALIGPNGIGKTTLFRIIMNQEFYDSGNVRLGSNVKIGYYDQEHQNLNQDKTIFDEISDEFPYLKNEEIRNTLAAFMFTGDNVFKSISSLSGGEKGRIALAKIMLSNANFLILDEPTNHLDINSKEILEDVIKNYEGTCLYISHDRYFINNTAEKIIELNKTYSNTILGNYDYYLEKKSVSKIDVNNNENILFESDNKKDWQRKKEEQSIKRKKENDIKKIETDIDKIESEINETDYMLTLEEVYTNPFKSKEIFDKKTELEKKLTLLYEKWEDLNS